MIPLARMAWPLFRAVARAGSRKPRKTCVRGR
jgi:hypothetical protein